MNEDVEMLIDGDPVKVSDLSVGFSYVESLYGSAVCTLKMTIPDPKLADKFVRDTDVPVSLRWAKNAERRKVWSAWKQLRFPKAEVRISRNATEFTLKGVDALWAKLARANSQRGCFDQQVSAVVTEIAARHKIRSVVIEPTIGTHRLYQCFLSDAHFIRQILMPHAMSESNRTDYNFYFLNGDTLVFRTPDVMRKESDYEFSLCVNEDRKKSLEILGELRLSHDRFALSKKKAWSVQVVGFDVASKQPLVFLAQDGSVPLPFPGGVGPAQGLPDVVEATAAPPPVDGNLLDFVTQAKSTWTEHARRRFSSTVILNNVDVTATPGQTVSITMRDVDNEERAHSGRYLIHAVRTLFFRGGLVTTLNISRRETK